MKIKLSQPWFAPSENHQVDDIRSRSGQRYQPGEHEVPDNLFDKLPSRTVVLIPPKDMSVQSPFVAITKRDLLKELSDQTTSRSMDQYQELHNEAELNRKEARKVILAKARAAKAKKKAENEATAEAEPVAV